MVDDPRHLLKIMQKALTKRPAANRTAIDEILPEYDFSKLRRNKYASRYAPGSVVVGARTRRGRYIRKFQRSQRCLRALAGIIKDNRRSSQSVLQIAALLRRIAFPHSFFNISIFLNSSPSSSTGVSRINAFAAQLRMIQNAAKPVLSNIARGRYVRAGPNAIRAAPFESLAVDHSHVIDSPVTRSISATVRFNPAAELDIVTRRQAMAGVDTESDLQIGQLRGELPHHAQFFETASRAQLPRQQYFRAIQ